MLREHEDHVGFLHARAELALGPRMPPTSALRPLAAAQQSGLVLCKSSSLPQVNQETERTTLVRRELDLTRP